jgi:hypothetical protein
MMRSTTEVTHQFGFEEYSIEVLWIEYDGGGMCWEYRVSRAGVVLVTSDDQWGGRIGAARGALSWIEESEDKAFGAQADIEK